MSYKFCNTIRDTTETSHSFNELSAKTFGLSFEDWYNRGYWTDKYIPYVLLDRNKVVSNVSVNIMDYNFHGQEKRFVQLGTVMTDENYRHRGLSKFLVKAVINEWTEKCDGIYLYANDNVVDFYPRFGFEKTVEYRYQLDTVFGNGIAIKLDMSKDDDVTLLLKSYKKGNPFSMLDMINNHGLIMFHCGQFMSDNVYYCKDYDTVVIAEFEGKVMICYDIYGTQQCNMIELLNTVAKPDTTQIILGFTPKKTSRLKPILIHEEDSTLFWHSSKKCIFSVNEIMFPLMSHA